MTEERPGEPAPAGGQMLIYQDGSLNLRVRLDGTTVWLTQAVIAELFQTTSQNITIHLRNIYDEGELAEAATCKEYLQVRQEGARRVERSFKHYSLDMIIAVGYRVRSHRGTQFRRWATAQLRLSKPTANAVRNSTPHSRRAWETNRHAQVFLTPRITSARRAARPSAVHRVRAQAVGRRSVHADE